MPAQGTEGLKRDDIIIAFMGPTGSGKSFFIDLLAGSEGVRSGSGMESVTPLPKPTRIYDPEGREVVLLDTPGFDDSKRTDKEVLTLISEWLRDTYKMDVKLSGLIYLHRIKDNRMAGTPYKNLRMFGKLCGDISMNRVILVTTMWQKLFKAEKREGVGEERERELKENFWKPLIDRGSRVERLNEASRDEAWHILAPLIATRDSDAVLLQEELVDKGIELKETQAGQELYTELQKRLRAQKEQMDELVAQAEQSSDPRLKKEVLARRAQLQKEFDKTFEDAKELKRSLLKKILRFFSSKTKSKAVEV